MKSKLGENLKRIRKEHNLSQEEFAEDLNVSRQAVSKWESNISYPDMDKILLICEKYNLNIDELFNQNYKEVKENKDSKRAFNIYINNILEYINKLLSFISSLSFKDKIKLLIEEIIITAILSLIIILIGLFLNNIFSSIFNLISYKVYNLIATIFYSAYFVIAISFGFIIIHQIFQIRYLNYYNYDDKNNVIDNENDYKNKKEKIIIRNSKNTNISKYLVKLIVFLTKVIIICCNILFCTTLMLLISTLIFLFLISKTKLLFIGLLIGILSLITINILIITINHKFIFDKKSSLKAMFITFIISIITLGCSISLSIIGISNLNHSKNYDNKVVTTKIVKYNKDYLIYLPELNVKYEINYIENNSNDLKIEIIHSDFYNYYIDEHKIYYVLNAYSKEKNFIEIFKTIINDLNNGYYINYSYITINLYTNKENIANLKNSIR